MPPYAQRCGARYRCLRYSRPLAESLAFTPEESFVESNPVPQDFQTIEEMWDWYQPLIDKEKSIE